MGIDLADSPSKTSINRANRKRKGKGLEDKKRERKGTTTYDKMSSQGGQRLQECTHVGAKGASNTKMGTNFA